MKKTAIRAFSAILSAALILALAMPSLAVDNKSYIIVSPYANVNWGTTKAYKGNLHTHSTISDANETMVDMLTEYYEQNFDFVAMTEHGVTGREWNVKPFMWGFYIYQELLGYERNWLSDEQYYGMTSGSYKLKSGEERGFGMTCVSGGNELNAITASKSHVNGFFLPGDVGNGDAGFENGFEYAVKLADDAGGFSHINHPGDWLGSSSNINAVYDEDNLQLFTDIFLKYDSCLGMEVFNGNNNTTPYDRILWDNLLMKVLPYGRTIIGFSNSDAHRVGMVDSTFSVFMMEDNTVETIRKTMQSGAFFGVTRKMRNNDVIGPDAEFNYIDQRLPYPMFSSLTVDGHTVSISAENTNYVQWIANGKVIMKQNITSADQNVALNLDLIEGSEDFLYIRAELFGDGGMCASQALKIDDGSAPLKYEEDTSLKARFDDFLFALKSTRFFVYIQEIIRAIG